jgi:hypothetical protein
MRKIQHSVRWHGWLFNAIEEWGKRHGGKNFSDSVNHLLTCELERLGYKPEFFEPGIYNQIKLKNLLKALPVKLREKIEKENAGYKQVLEKYNMTVNAFFQEAEKDDEKYLHIPSIEEEYGMCPDKNQKKAPLNDEAEQKKAKAG